MGRDATRRGFLKGSAQLLAAGLMSSVDTSGSRAAKPSKPRIKIGQIGTGHAHASKLEVYRKSADYEVVGVVEPDAALREQALKRPAFRDLPWMSEEELLNVAGLQAVTVETRVRDLLPTAERSTAAGKHVHLDKPAGESLVEYRRILETAAKGRLMVQMGYMYRYSPPVVLLRKFLREGWLGDVFEVHAVMSKVVPEGARKGLAEYRGGIMFELGCHIIDLVIGVLGKPERVQSYARRSAAFKDRLLDNMLAVFEYPSAIATVKSSAVEVDGGSRRHLVVCGTRGTFQIQPLDAPQVVFSLDRDCGPHPKGTHEARFGSFERYVADAADMAQIIREQKECEFPYAHDLAVQESVLLACGLPTNT